MAVHNRLRWFKILVAAVAAVFLAACEPGELATPTEPPTKVATLVGPTISPPIDFPTLNHHLISPPFGLYCIEEPLVVVVPSFPIGCEVIDCCPGCPGPGPIDLSVLAGGNLVESVLIEFEPGDQDFDIQPVEVAPGVPLELANLAVAGTGERPIEALAKFVLDQELIHTIVDSPASESDGEPVGSVEIVMEQSLSDSDFVVNEMVFVVLFRRCIPDIADIGVVGDSIDLRSNDGNDNAVVLFDGRRDSGCVDDEIHRGTDVVQLGNVLSDGNCNAEFTVFSDDDRATFVDSATPPWTDTTPDLVVTELDDMYAIPITIWLVDTNNTVLTNFQTAAQTHINRAIQVYNATNSGITYQVNWQQVTNNADVTTVQNTLQNVINTLTCTTGPITGNANLFNGGQINIYYATWAGANGFSCGDDFIAMTAATATPETLAHEIGHSLDLEHYTAANTNIMWRVGIPGRNNFTIGQVFRMNLNSASSLNTLNVRSGATRDCPHGTTSPTCPAITLDTANK